MAGMAPGATSGRVETGEGPGRGCLFAVTGQAKAGAAKGTFAHPLPAVQLTSKKGRGATRAPPWPQAGPPEPALAS